MEDAPWTEITDAEALVALLGEPIPRVRDKVRTTLTDLDRAWLAASPFCVLATASADGSCDASPKGDPAGDLVILTYRETRDQFQAGSVGGEHAAAAQEGEGGVVALEIARVRVAQLGGGVHERHRARGEQGGERLEADVTAPQVLGPLAGLEEACRQAARWQEELGDAAPRTVTVNV